MSDPTSDPPFRPVAGPRRRRDGAAWEAIVREERAKIRRRSPAGPRVVPAGRRGAPDAPGSTPPAAA